MARQSIRLPGRLPDCRIFLSGRLPGQRCKSLSILTPVFHDHDDHKHLFPRRDSNPEPLMRGGDAHIYTTAGRLANI